jgi:hypothetical protein
MRFADTGRLAQSPARAIVCGTDGECLYRTGQAGPVRMSDFDTGACFVRIGHGERTALAIVIPHREKHILET